MSHAITASELHENAALIARQRLLEEVLAKSTIDRVLRQRLLVEPVAVLAEHGLVFPDGFTVKCIENEHDVTVVLPNPLDEMQELSDADLQQVAGGGWTTITYATTSSSFCLGVSVSISAVSAVSYILLQ